MHVHFEQNTCTRTDSNFLSLSWMGKVPEDLPEEGGGWKLNRAQYYVEGWLASGNARGVVGVTFSTSHCHTYDAPPRSNFNLRGHRSEVVLVRWNEPYQKLATCDSRGVIFVWIKHEGRWSIELINDRNIQVTDFAWSHDGRMALICYRDGFILVGSVAGQRYWSSMLNLESTSITCGVWSPDDQQVMFGTMDGQIIVMSSAGILVTQTAVHEGFEITGMAWSCERFNMEEAETGRDGADHGTKDASLKTHVLAVCFKYGDIFLMSGYDDICPVMVYTTLTGVKIDWSNCGEYLAVGGFVRLPNLQCRNEVHFYSKDGSLIHSVTLPSQGKPLTAMTWGHNDKRLFLAAGCHMYVAWVSKQVAPLQFLCQRVVHQSVRTEKAVDKLPLPQRLRCGVKALFSPTIKSYIPDPLRLREFVCSPPPGGERLFCTMIRHGEETSGGHYTLYLEYLGGLVPLLKGKRASKLRPDFIIYDPKIKSSGKAEASQTGGTIESDTSSESDAEVYTDGCGSPRMQRRRRNKVFRAEKVNRSITFRTLDELMFDDNLPETNRLVEVTSNIWGTKFQITGVASSLPACLGQVIYKTSLLHLQPRQMTITITEIMPSRPVLSRDPNFTPAPHSVDDDDDYCTSEGDVAGERKTVEVTVHDMPSVQSEDGHISQEGKSVEDGGESVRSASVDTALIEHAASLNEDIGGHTGKLGASGTVRSRSLSPVRNSLTQTSPVFKQDGVCSDPRPDANSINGWQGARPKAPASRRHPSTPGSCSNRNGIPNSSPKLSGITSNKCAALINSNSGNTYSSCHYANTNGVLTHSTPTCTNRVESYPFSTPVTVGVTKLDKLPGFKRMDVGNCSGGGGVGIEGMWRHEEPSSPPLLRDHSALPQHETGSSSTSAEDVMIPLVDSGKGAVPRWADPAAEAVKLLEEGVAESSNMPFENNLVADCSPTAPTCLDLHRRLYLAQQNIVDTGTPISPSSCPACLPIQCISGEMWSSTADIVSHIDLIAQNNLRSYTSGSFGQHKERTESKTSGDSWRCPVHDSPAVYCACLTKAEALDCQHGGASALTNRSVLPCHRDQPHSPPQSSSQDTARTSDSSYIQQVMPQLIGDVELDSASQTPRSASQNQGNWHQEQSLATPDESLPALENTDFGDIPSHDHPADSRAHHHHHFVAQTSVSHLHSTLTKDLSSFDKLSLILSEDPSAQHSAHNFRSMPGFVMRNPDTKDEDDMSSLPEGDIYDSLDEHPAVPYTYNEAVLNNNNIHDSEIQHTSASLPSSPIRFGAKQKPNIQNLHEEILKGRCRHLSPLLGRRSRDIQLPATDFLGLDDPRLNNYENLEAFQKAQLRQKVRRHLSETSARHEQNRTFTMHNKAPLWNETSQVYQLDFGGRVTQESAKNFQIELRGRQVMQFGRIDNNAYTLDFQHPFTAIQAFAVALANVTQRLK